ncbi:mitogen-activated protein kinase kinase kinase-like [Sitodiplosis mosellana]|uniref:mitogen-activated protein kinase kinase kinase-like n=1 Tax=Sitodiplosis mosellana TaxID=263140 RepID=UPI0024445B94|nr:mitogen-activated protein kinase kinase kinase-like [Sitodiplosis mosellana]XP_055309715.1 mitogen-activated protein kinase kinase kinase-like [Sitodiplosis mosellana]
MQYSAIYDYEPQTEDDLSLKRGTIVTLLTKDSEISGYRGWWTGRIGNKIGIFPSSFVTDCDSMMAENQSEINGGAQPLEIDFRELRLEETIGSGGYSEVKRGYWRKTEVAIKIQNQRGNQDKTLEFIMKEAKLLSSLKHENIVSLYGACLTPPKFCIVMELAHGGSLQQVLAKHKILPNVLVEWATQIARGMNYLHNGAPISVLHRDLKSFNVLISERIDEHDDLRNKTLKITDFGLAHEDLGLAHSTMQMSAAGTCQWMSLELIKCGQFSKASDVWSYGVVLWELLTGEIPYKGLDYGAIMYGVGGNKIRPSDFGTPILKSFPETWGKLMKSCWDKDPHKRPSFKDILRELDTVDRSGLSETPNNTFHTMQDGWKKEIAEIVHEMRMKEEELTRKEDELKQKQIQLEALEQDLLEKNEEFEARKLHHELEIINIQNTQKPQKKRSTFSKLRLNEMWDKFRHQLPTYTNTMVVNYTVLSDPNLHGVSPRRRVKIQSSLSSVEE